MRCFVLAASLVAGLGVAACAPPPDRATKTEDQLDPARWTQLMDATANAVVADQNDCSKMAKDIELLFKTNAALVAAANKATTDGQSLPDAANARIASDVQRMMPGIDACGSEPAVQTAFKLAKFKSDG